MRDFDQEIYERRLNEPRSPISARQFRLAGETLAWANSIPAGAVVSLGRALRYTNEAQAAAAMSEAIESLLDPSSVDAFYKALENTYPATRQTPDGGEEPHPLAGERIVDIEALQQMYVFLMGSVSNRPPTQRSTSPAPSNGNGQASTPDSPSAAQTFETSTSTDS